MLCHVDWSVVTNILQDHSTFIFRVKQSKNSKHTGRYGYIIQVRMTGAASQWEWWSYALVGALVYWQRFVTQTENSLIVKS
jgi:hypothetical protein